MSIPLPDLDDRTYADLTAQAQALIPALQPAWTNYNPSDPGIVLIELLAWLTEMLIFQVNQIPAANTEKFLKLLNGPGWVRPGSASLEDAIRQTVLSLRERYRAVTSDDYEWLALNAWPESEAAAQLDNAGQIRRVRCVPRRDLSATDPAVRAAPAPAHVSLVVVAEPGTQPVPDQQPAGLLAALWTFFDARRTLTTRHHVVGPDFLPIEVAANLALLEDSPPDETLQAARQALTEFFDPLTGGSDQAGWPFGRAVYASEVTAVLEGLLLVDYVEDVQLTAPANPDRVQSGETGDGGTVVVGIELDAHELVRLQATTLVAYDVHGKQYSEPGMTDPGTSQPAAQPAASSYLGYLPAIFRQDPFAGRFLLAFEAVLSGLGAEPPGLETTIGNLGDYLDPVTTTAEFLPWLAGWVTLSLRADWDEATKRSFIQQIVPLYRLRGTQTGLERLLELYTGQLPEIDDDFEDPSYFFQVRLKLTEADPALLQLKQQIARAIIDQEKPAHTFYALQVAVPTMRLVSLALHQETNAPLLILGQNTLLGTNEPQSLTEGP